MFKGIKFMLSSKLVFAKQNTEGTKSTTVQHSLDENIFEKHELYIVQVVFHLLRSSQDMPEKAMALHSSTLAWKIPWAEEPGRLQSIGLLGVGHDWETSLSLSLFTFMHWRRKWNPLQCPWRIPGTGEPGGLLSLGSHKVGHNWSDAAAAAAAAAAARYACTIFQEKKKSGNIIPPTKIIKKK